MSRRTMTPDADLVADCATFTALQARLDRTVCRAPAGSAAERRYETRLVPLWDQLDALADRISRRTATTPAGHHARVQALLSYPEVTLVEGIQDQHQGRIILALLRDMAHDMASYTMAAA